ncbi:tyrosine-type recombinase/integrase [Streptococcus pneumoniae]|uniref:tyrosine-type recombinase/integrase n=24 Tax=Streptococcus pneumoniae TaxID=1313 RepID=UPI0007667E7C|nr:tyrosine-type recombinase/integrase [Streptococcus pneumoniae]CWI74368.1 type I restriction-modification enzyme 1%2C S subunit [Streptococcus pneumoniae]
MKKVKLGEVLSLKKGKKATVLAEQTTLSQRYIQIDDLRNNNNLKFTESLNMTEALPDDILIAWDGANAGTVGYGLSGAVGSTITVLKKNERYKEKIISDYLGVFLESKSQYLREHSTGATIPHLNKNILLDLQLELLGIEEQENIICILNTIKGLITKRKLQLDELNLLVKSRFNEMFGDPLNNNKKFAVKTGQQCFKFSSGKFLDKHDRVFEGYPAYGGNGIAWKSRKYLIDNPTIIIGRVGAYCGNVRTTHGKVWISDNAIYIKEFKNSDFNLVFLLELMKVIHLRNYLNDRKDSHPALFVTLVGKAQRLGIAGVEIRLRKLGDKLGIQKVHPHKFRRTLATKAIDKGMPIEQVQKLLGHSKIDTTLAYAMVNQNNVKHSHQKFIS